MNVEGFWACIILVPIFASVGFLFAIMKEKSAKFVSGFNFLPKEEQKLYDKAYIARDMRNSCFIWAFVLFIGAILSYTLTPYAVVAAYIIWLILFFKDVHLDAHKAFEKYMKK